MYEYGVKVYLYVGMLNVCMYICIVWMDGCLHVYIYVRCMYICLNACKLDVCLLGVCTSMYVRCMYVC